MPPARFDILPFVFRACNTSPLFDKVSHETVPLLRRLVARRCLAVSTHTLPRIGQSDMLGRLGGRLGRWLSLAARLDLCRLPSVNHALHVFADCVFV